MKDNQLVDHVVVVPMSEITSAKTRRRKLPVGSVVREGDRLVFARDIDARHIFAVNGFTAIGMDEPVVRHLEEVGVEEVRYYRTDADRVLRAGIGYYRASKPRNMAGRLQRFVSMTAFKVDKGGPLPRPNKRVEVA